MLASRYLRSLQHSPDSRKLLIKQLSMIGAKNDAENSLFLFISGKIRQFAGKHLFVADKPLILWGRKKDSLISVILMAIIKKCLILTYAIIRIGFTINTYIYTLTLYPLRVRRGVSDIYQN
jgi:hypothetical protein